MKFKKLALVTILLMVVAAWGSSPAATVDPYLTRLEAQYSAKAEGAPFSLALEKVLALEDSEDPDDPLVGVILHLSGGMPDLSRVPGLARGSHSGSIATARMPLSSLGSLAAIPGIERIEASRMSYPEMDVAVPAGNVDQVWSGAPAYTGQGVLVGVIDTGIDWHHDDFKNPDGTTRIKAIWDLFGSGLPPAGFNYGAEYTEASINGSNVAEADYVGHGTHVSGIAAGNGQASSGLYKGVAFASDILFAKAFDDQNGGFASDKTIDAINYLVQKAQTLNQPLAINMSLGGHSGPHDGTAGQEVVVNQVSGTGVTICIAAGNEGESFIHDSTSASGGQVSFFVSDTYTPNPGTGNDFAVLEIWVEQATSVTVTTPGGVSCGPVVSGNGNAGYDTANGVVVVDNASQGTDPNNGDQMIFIQLDDQTGTNLSGGTWTVAFSGGSGTAHLWKIASSMSTGFPNSDNSYSVGSPGNAEEAVTVAAWKSRNTWPSSIGNQSYPGSWGSSAVNDRAPFSSIGPSRDGREKPDVSAPGMAIISCYSQDSNPVPDAGLRLTGDKYYVTQGTSMATPFTCGVTALLLEKNPDLTSAQVKAALRNSAMHDNFTGQGWNARFGAGKVDAAAAIAAVSGAVTNPNGDVDLDGQTTVLDVVRLVNYILDQVGSPLSPQGLVNANVNGDTVIDALDLVRIVAFILGTDSPGKSFPGQDPARFAVGAPYLQDDTWWVDVTLSGQAVAAGQFALNLDGGSWDPARAELTDPAAGHLAVRTVGLDSEQLRVLVYDLDNELPAEGLTLRLAFGNDDPSPESPRTAGLLVVGSDGQERETVTEIASVLPRSRLTVAPNPTRSESSISFRLGNSSGYALSVYDLRGRLVRVLDRGKAGDRPLSVGWDGRDGSGRDLPSGIYFVRLQSRDEILTEKLVLTR